MITSKRLNEISAKIHELAKNESVHAWDFSPKLHMLIAQRNNLVNELLRNGVKSSSFVKTILDFQTPQLNNDGDVV